MRYLVLGRCLDTNQDVVLFTYGGAKQVALQVAERENIKNGSQYVEIRAIKIEEV